MYDFNPLPTLFLLKSLPADNPFPPLRPLLRRLIARLTTRPRFRTPPTPNAEPRERTFSRPTPAAYNLHARPKAPAR